ncbi:DUF883 family protein [Methylohalobius crimeensis]|uniref:DUF883 family protein n=1 Tax=Methylohalobius crimeensis TaxID=244365 RepID=UPI0003B6EF43|nr:hypothetical protein [Methylohalobius crimeensis]
MAEVERDIESLKADIRKLGQDISQLTKTVGDLASETVQAQREHWSEATDSAVKEAGRAVGDARKTVEGKIEEKPFLSILAAFGLGLIAGKLLSR